MKFNELVELAENAFKDNKPYVSKMYWDNAKTKLQTVSYFDANGYLHRDDGPAVTWYDDFYGKKEMEKWMKHGMLHRLDGPAWIYYYTDGKIRTADYFINDKEYTKEEFDEYTKGLESKEDKELLVDLGQTFE